MFNWLFKWKKIPAGPPQPRIEVFVRHCTYSSISANKKRPSFFSKELCHKNLLETSDSRVNLTYFLDEAKAGEHFLKGSAIKIQDGTEAGSFLKMVEYVVALDLHPDTIIYFLEDDYLHKNGWVDVLFEGFSLDADYVTLYDHRDKYLHYPKLFSKIFITPTCHWRTTPSTTNTYAMRFATLLKDLKAHQRFSMARKVTADHNKFLFLGKKGRVLISSVPGWATHCDPELLSPCTRWEQLFEKGALCNRSL